MHLQTIWIIYLLKVELHQLSASIYEYEIVLFSFKNDTYTFINRDLISFMNERYFCLQICDPLFVDV